MVALYCLVKVYNKIQLHGFLLNNNSYLIVDPQNKSELPNLEILNQKKGEFSPFDDSQNEYGNVRKYYFCVQFEQLFIVLRNNTWPFNSSIVPVCSFSKVLY